MFRLCKAAVIRLRISVEHKKGIHIDVVTHETIKLATVLSYPFKGQTSSHRSACSISGSIYVGCIRRSSQGQH